MARKRTPGSRPGLVYCENCGEEYSSSYRRCPFCAEYEAELNGTAGKREVRSKLRGGGYKKKSKPGQIISGVISVLVIAALIWLIVAKLVPLIQQGHLAGSIDPDTLPSASLSPEPTPEASPEPTPEASPEPTPEATPTPTPTPAVTPDTSGGDVVAVPNNATGISLNKTGFTINNQYPYPVTLKVTLYPYGATGAVTWSSSDDTIATVDENGVVRHGTNTGSAIITATLYNGETATCQVINRVTNG